jgi:hypothetical protein
MSYLELRGISKIYGVGATEVRALDRRRISRGGHGFQRLWQEHAADHRR